jgi:hypothetical protein
MDKTAELEELLTRALALVKRNASTRPSETPLAAEVAAQLIPDGTQLWASKAATGKWYYYLVLPYGVQPANGVGWTTNPDSYRCWYSAECDENTEQAVLREGLIKLLANRPITSGPDVI